MIDLLECNAHAALCRQLATLEPDSKTLWLAEADRWSRLKQEREVASRYTEPAETWCWKIIGMRKPLDVKMTEFRNPAKVAAGMRSRIKAQ